MKSSTVYNIKDYYKYKLKCYMPEEAEIIMAGEYETIPEESEIILAEETEIILSKAKVRESFYSNIVLERNKLEYNKDIKEVSGEILKDGVNSMDNNDILFKYIDKVDRDQSELKTDIRESEKKIFDQIQSSEKRIFEHTQAMENRLVSIVERIEDKIDVQNTEVQNIKDKVYESNKQYKWWVIGIFVAIVSVILASSYAVVQIVLAVKGLK